MAAADGTSEAEDPAGTAYRDGRARGRWTTPRPAGCWRRWRRCATATSASGCPCAGDGVMAEIAAAFNEVADRNSHLTAELRRVRRVVGREGKLTERLDPAGAPGSWAAAIDAANALVDDLVRPVSEVGRVLSAVAEGDLSQRMELRRRTDRAAAR